jgi:pimeloyl-ACP methyl ester carboxylesterase
VEKMLPLLINPTDASNPAFHVVAPSLPGFGFSQPPSKKNFGLPQYAEVCHKLMINLGYNNYVCLGYDWGFGVTRTIAKNYYPRHCKAHFVTTPYGEAPHIFRHPILWLRNLFTPYSQREKEHIEANKRILSSGSGYADLQSTKPQTLGYSLADSPVGLLAWIYEKLREWSDDYDWTDDEILTWISIYWFSPGTAASSVRIYYEVSQLKQLRKTYEWQPCPLGVSFFPKELSTPPRNYVRTLGKIVFESEDHKRGGHFAAFEQPHVVVNDMMEMYKKGGPAYGVVEGATGYDSPAINAGT